MFVHTLDVIPRNWYIQLELCQEIVDWECLTEKFIATFSFEDENVIVETTLQLIKEKFFEGIEESEDSLPCWEVFAKQALECYKVDEERQEDDEPREVHVLEIKGERDIEGVDIDPDYTKPLKNRKVNIGTEEVPKFSFIGEYWDEENVGKVGDLLQEYRELFPTKFIEMKGITGELGEMKIPLKHDFNLVKQRPYRLNPRYKEKVKVEIYKMHEAGIIEPVEESNWIIPMVMQDKKIGKIRICIDLRKLNDACIIDLFPTPFTDEVLDNVGVQ